MSEVSETKRTYKDSLFRMIFQDREALLSLYNAINGTCYDQPEELIIGGGISGAAELFLPQTQERIAKMVYSRASRVQTRIRPAEFGNDAGIVGAARLGDM